MLVPDEGGTPHPERGVMPTQSMASQHLAQSQRINRSCALLDARDHDVVIQRL
jgi:hypothetical protein